MGGFDCAKSSTGFCSNLGITKLPTVFFFPVVNEYNIMGDMYRYDGKLQVENLAKYYLNDGF